MNKFLSAKTLLIVCMTLIFGGGSSFAQKYTKTDIGSLTTGDIIVIADQTSEKALPNTTKTSGTQSVAAITLNTDKTEITSEVTEDLKWEITVNPEGTYLFKNPTTNEHLYIYSDNRGVRVGTDQTAFTWDANTNKLKGNGRFIGVYNQQDWRSYTSNHNNIIKTVTAFYKQEAGGKQHAGIEYTVTDYNIKYGETFQAPTLTNPNNLTPTYTIECNPAGMAAIDAQTGDVTVNGIGSATITATTPENETYYKGTASYTLTVSDPNQATYSKVTNVDQLIAGAKYIVVNETNLVALGLINADKNGEAVAVKINNETGKITIDTKNSASNPYEITLGGTTGAYTLTTEQGILGFSNDNLFSTDGTNSTWGITFSAQGNAVFENTVNQFDIRYNANMKKFRLYASSSGTLKVQLYIKDGSQPETGSFTISEDRYTTYYTEKAFVMPAGATGGIITAADENNGTLTTDYRYTEGTTVPAKTALLIKGEPKTYNYTCTETTATAEPGNMLHATVDAQGYTHVEGTDVKYYMLSHDATKTNFGFYWGTANGAPFINKAPHAYLAITNAAKAPTMFSIEGGDGTTGIDAIETETETRTGVYSVTGVYMGTTTENLPAGIYIKDGKKIIKK